MPYAQRRPCHVASCRELQPCEQHSVLPRALYNQRGWRVRAKRYLRAHPFCASCRARGRATRATQVDHVVPHKGDTTLFWAEHNWQSLCSTCHGAKSRREG